MDLLKSPAVLKACNNLGVPFVAKDDNLAIALFGFVFFAAAQWASHALSPKLFPRHFTTMSAKTREDWDLHFTGWLHSLISTPLALHLIFNPTPSLSANPIFGYATREGAVIAFSGGYFLYDLVVSLYLIRTHGVPFVIHAGTCCFIFFKAFTPFMIGMSSMFLVWEFSTVFLHPHWFMDKLDLTGSLAQLINGACLLASFFGARICYGGYMTYVLWNLLDDPRIPPTLKWGFRVANLALMGLNVSWFRLMIISVLGRVKGKSTKDRVVKNGKNGQTTSARAKKSQ